MRGFFADLCAWATEPDSPFAGHAPAAVPLSRYDLLDTGFTKARLRTAARLTGTVLDLQREIPTFGPSRCAAGTRPSRPGATTARTAPQ